MMTNVDLVKESRTGDREHGNSFDLDHLISQLLTPEGGNKAVEMAVERGFLNSNYVHLAVADKEEELENENITPENILWLRVAASIAKRQGDQARAVALAQRAISFYDTTLGIRESFDLLEEYFGKDEAKKRLPQFIEEVEKKAAKYQINLESKIAEVCRQAGDLSKAISYYLQTEDFERAHELAHNKEERKRIMEAQAESLDAIQGFFYRKKNMGELSLSFDDMNEYYGKAKESILKGGKISKYEVPDGYQYLHHPQLELAEFAVKAGNKADARLILEQAVQDELRGTESESSKKDVDNTFLSLAAEMLDELGFLPQAREAYGEVIKTVLQSWKTYAQQHEHDDPKKTYDQEKGEYPPPLKIREGANLAKAWGFWEEAVDLYAQAAFRDFDEYGPLHLYTTGLAIKHAARIAREKLGDEQRAQELYTKATKNVYLEEAGLTWEEAGHPEKARECYEKAGQLYEEDGKKRHVDLRDLEDAYRCFTKAGNGQKAKEMQEHIEAKKKGGEVHEEEMHGKNVAQEEPPTIDHMLTAEREGNFRLAKEYAGKLQHPLQEVYGSLNEFFHNLGELSHSLKYGFFKPMPSWGPASIQPGDEKYILF